MSQLASNLIQLSEHFSSPHSYGTGVLVGSGPTKRFAVSSSPSHKWDMAALVKSNPVF